MMPNKQEILTRATTLFMSEQTQSGYGDNLPEESELKESGFFDKARQELMTQDPDIVDQALKEIAESNELESQNDGLKDEIQKLNQELRQKSAQIEQSKLLPREQQGEIRKSDTDTNTIQIRKGICKECGHFGLRVTDRTRPYWVVCGFCEVYQISVPTGSWCRSFKESVGVTQT